MNYYEILFDNEYGVCIKGVRQPSTVVISIHGLKAAAQPASYTATDTSNSNEAGRHDNHSMTAPIDEIKKGEHENAERLRRECPQSERG